MEKLIQFWNWLFGKKTKVVKSSWETNKGRPAPKRRGRPKKK
tara:strand:+ start:840 stop:965 length:126 start_codon:yes stop_codon:yes gene_type:complete